MASKKKSAPSKKKAVKKTAAKKPVSKSKPAKKVVKKSVKKAVKKTVKKAVKKTAKKAAKPAAKKPVPKNKAKIQSAKPLATAVKAAPKAQIDYTKAITPLLDRLVVRVITGERVTAGGLLIIPDTALMATGYLKAEVLAVGSGNKSKKGYLKPLDVKVGDKVLFAEYAGTKVQFNSEELHIIHEADVMGILEE